MGSPAVTDAISSMPRRRRSLHHSIRRTSEFSRVLNPGTADEEASELARPLVFEEFSFEIPQQVSEPAKLGV